MSVGMSVVNFANKALNHLTGNATWTAPAGLYVQLHKGDPGASGVLSPSAVTTRKAATFAAASSAGIALTGTLPLWARPSMTATETISHLTVWDASTGGNFLFSLKLNVPKSVVNGDGLALDSLTMKIAASALAS